MVFWIVVGLMWVIVKGFGSLPMSLIVVLVFIIFVVVTAYATLLPLYTKVFVVFVELVKMHRKRTRTEYYRLKTKSRKALFLEAKSIRPIKFNYGPFFCIDESFVANQLYLMSQRICDAILVFHF